MEAVARQFATDEHVMVIRNGWFSYRWTEIFDMGGPGKSICASHTVLKAQPVKCSTSNGGGDNNASLQNHDDGSIVQQYEPHPIDNVIEKVKLECPKVLFAPHVETSTGMILPDEYIRKAAEAVHDVGGLFVLDCIASGAIWVSRVGLIAWAVLIFRVDSQHITLALINELYIG
jgi:aspartate aminotransferase-like enzyme